jgi:hypothetical protein
MSLFGDPLKNKNVIELNVYAPGWRTRNREMEIEKTEPVFLAENLGGQ